MSSTTNNKKPPIRSTAICRNAAIKMRAMLKRAILLLPLILPMASSFLQPLRSLPSLVVGTQKFGVNDASLRQQRARSVAGKAAVVEVDVDFDEEWKKSVEDGDEYWLSKSQSLTWSTPPSTSLTGSFKSSPISYFKDGFINACANCLDRHVESGMGDKVAILYEADEIGDGFELTYKEALRRVIKISNMLKDNGVSKGDVVTIYMPMTPDVILSMLACARIGAVHSVIFAGFSKDAIRDRVLASGSRHVITSDYGVRGGKIIKLKDTIDKALDGLEVDRVFVFERLPFTGEDVNFVEGRDVWAREEISKAGDVCEPVVMNAEDPLFILYTSGSTGSPKGILHTTGGYLLYALQTTKTSFGLKSSDVFACVADAGWITGHTYICYGPLLNGVTTTVFESTPLYPNEERYWDLVESKKVNVFYTAPTAIRSLMRFGDAAPKKYDLSSLRVLGTVGEPINPAAWEWYNDIIGGGKCDVVDTYWQTETGGHVGLNLPGVHEPKPGSCRGGTFGVEFAILDPASGTELEGNDVEGVLVIKKPWPGMARTCLGDHERFVKTYLSPYPGYYFTGDGARRDEDGYIWVTGRVDDVINVSGHRIGTAEVESSLVANPAVAQAAVVGFPHEVKGEGIAAFCTLVKGATMDDEIRKSLKMAVRSGIGPFAAPDLIVDAPALPMTRSGKIMRR